MSALTSQQTPPSAKKMFTKSVDAGFIQSFDSQRNTEIAALLLALDNHFNIGTFVTSLSRAVIFATKTSSRIVLEVDPRMLTVPPDGVKFEYGKPLDPVTPEIAKACERMFVGNTTYLASGGQIISPDTYKGCFATVYPEFITSTKHGTGKKEDKALAKALTREREIHDLIDQKRFDIERLDVASRSLKDPEQAKKALAEVEIAKKSFAEEVKKFQIELADVDATQQEVMKLRGQYLLEARKSLDMFSFYTIADGRKWKIMDDPLYSTRDHQLIPYGLLGAACDQSQIAFSLYYHGEAEFDLDAFTTEPLEFFDHWQVIRKKTMDAIVGGKVPFEKLPRRTTIVHFWFHISLFNEFIGKIFTNRAVFMQNRIAERNQVLMVQQRKRDSADAHTGNENEEEDAEEEVQTTAPSQTPLSTVPEESNSVIDADTKGAADAPKNSQ